MKNSFLNENRRDVLLVAGLSLLFMFLFYYKNLVHPSTFLFNDSGDGLKTYYVYDYHIKNDSTYNYTTSGNYPYGELQVFTDGQLLFANTFKVANTFIPGFSNYSIAFMNLMMLLSFPISIVFILLILKKLGVNSAFSIIGSCLVGFLSPQIYRLAGHYGLAYCFIIPLLWYLQLLFFENTSGRNTFLIFLCLLIVPHIHTYFLLICGLFVAINWLIFAILKKDRNYFIHTIPHILVQVLLPMVLFQLYIKAIDTHTNRSTEPYGILTYVADFYSVFIPHRGPFKSFINSIIPSAHQEWEGWSYIGTSVLLLLSITSVIGIVFFLKKKLKALLKNVPTELSSSVFASIFILLYSFGYPIKFENIYHLDFIAPLKQFRALGRFSWIFYYVITVFAIFSLSKIYSALVNRGYKIIGITFSFMLGIVSLVEAIDYHQDVAPTLSMAKNQFSSTLLNTSYKQALSAIDKNNYQAIIPLPFFLIGSEAQTRDVPDSTKKSALYFAYHSGLPLVASTSPRCSMEEARKQLQLFAPSFLKKESKKDFTSTKPFLILYCKDGLREDEQALLNKCTKIYSNEYIELYELTFNRLFEFTAKEELAKFDSIKDNLFRYNDFLLSKNNTHFYYTDFENSPSDTTFENSIGCKRGQIKDYISLLDNNQFQVDANVEYIASFWMYNKGTFVNSGMAVIEERDPYDAVVGWASTCNLSESSKILGNWSLIEQKFSINTKGNSILLFTKGDDHTSKIVYRDRLLIRPSDVTIYKILESKNGKTTKLFMNNYIIQE